MLKLGSTYLIVKDMTASISFYEALLNMKVSAQRFDRWAQFNFEGHCIALFNPKYDAELIKKGENIQDHFSENYLAYHANKVITYGNNFVLNFYIDDIKKEHERLKQLKIGEVTDLMYLHISSPYHHFLVIDPDGNTIEITGYLDDIK
jgi:lactoylglutathione lyase